MWDVLNKMAAIMTIVGFPVVLYSAYEIVYKGIAIYDAYTEPNEANGDTLNIGSFTRNDYRKGKKRNPMREYHRKGYDYADKDSWK